MFQGLRTVIYNVEDLDRAKAWYSQLLAKPPYFAEPLYVGFNVGGFELGAEAHRPLRGVGGGIIVGSVFDPFGNVVGLIENPHFKLEP